MKQSEFSQSLQPSFKPQINKKSSKLTQQKAPIYSTARYKQELEERNQKMEALKQRRQDELMAREQ